jgi:hypothetical protein
MEDKNLFKYVDNVKLDDTQKAELISGEIPQFQVVRRRGGLGSFAPMAGMAAGVALVAIVLVGILSGGFDFFSTPADAGFPPSEGQIALSLDATDSKYFNARGLENHMRWYGLENVDIVRVRALTSTKPAELVSGGRYIQASFMPVYCLRNSFDVEVLEVLNGKVPRGKMTIEADAQYVPVRTYLEMLEYNIHWDMQMQKHVNADFLYDLSEAEKDSMFVKYISRNTHYFTEMEAGEEYILILEQGEIFPYKISGHGAFLPVDSAQIYELIEINKPDNPQPPKPPVSTKNPPNGSFWRNELFGEESVTKIYDSLKYHADYAEFVAAYPKELDDIYDIEIFCFDFLRHIRIPTELIPETFEINGHINKREYVREQEFDKQTHALRIAQAFVEKNTEFLMYPFSFYSTPGLFDFIHEVEFTEFLITGADFDIETYNYIYYFSIKTAVGDNIFANSGETEWELHLNYPVVQFSPVNVEMNRIHGSRSYSELVNFCQAFSTYVRNIEWDGGNNAHGALIALLRLYDYNGVNEYGAGYFTTDYFIELAKYALNMDFTYDMLEGLYGYISENERDRTKVYVPAMGGSAAVSTFVSEVVTDNSATIVMNHWGDSGLMFLAETVEYNLELGERGWRLVSVNTLYSNSDINVSVRGH